MPGSPRSTSSRSTVRTVALMRVPTLMTDWGGDEAGIREVFQRARLEAPCVLVLEDLDSLINDDNRSFFLNEVDGLEDNDGLLMVSLLSEAGAKSRSARRTTSIVLTQRCRAVRRDSTENSEPTP